MTYKWLVVAELHGYFNFNADSVSQTKTKNHVVTVVLATMAGMDDVFPSAQSNSQVVGCKG